MPSKNKRQRGSRTHGGGTHKNRRGAGHRGGRGKAGRSKHEQHNHEPLGKTGFKRPQQTQEEEHTVNIEEIDEILYEISVGVSEVDELEGVREVTGQPPIQAYKELEQTGDGVFNSRVFVIDITQISDDAKEADFSKLLGGGRIRNTVVIRTEMCSQSAKQSVKSKGGIVSYTTNGDGFKNRSKIEKAISRWDLKLEILSNNNAVDSLEEYLEKTESDETLRFEEFNETVERGLSSDEPDLAYDIMRAHVQNISQVDGLEAINLMRARDYAKEFGFDPEPFEEEIEAYFEQVSAPEKFTDHMAEELPSEMSVMDVLSGLERLYDTYDFPVYEENPELRSEGIEEDERQHLLAVDKSINWI